MTRLLDEYELERMKFFSLIVLLLCPLLATAQLSVTVMPPKIAGQKAVVQLKLKSDFTNTIQSARAVCFLLGEQGKMVGQSTKWIIGQNKTGLEPKGETTFNFVITSLRPFTTTNLTAQVSFSKLILEGGKSANIKETVQIKN